ncbi:hypothetical protein [Diplocloster modestus]|uniref:Uncharacterized protein n=1 Tax=Diplocloster modestus TaxID=2850322 RepID=A0ABS6K0X6_9FIRM|nr:hypothetical protein [Diplocloster modestus]MBU9724506.1 hypothetical protein [Diplocloster modestus]
MKKYDLRKIMKRAWEIKKEDSRNIFALCLKMAWEEAKEMTLVIEMRSSKDINRIFRCELNLEGTEKQISYASHIINRKLDKTNVLCECMMAGGKMTVDEYHAGMDSLMDQFSAMTSAKYVIEHVR